MQEPKHKEHCCRPTPASHALRDRCENPPLGLKLCQAVYDGISILPYLSAAQLARSNLTCQSKLFWLGKSCSPFGIPFVYRDRCEHKVRERESVVDVILSHGQLCVN